MYTGQSVETLMIEALSSWVDIDRAVIKQPSGGGIELKIQNADLKPEVLLSRANLYRVTCRGPRTPRNSLTSVAAYRYLALCTNC